MSLDSRKLKILQAIINDYIEIGEPVGSTTINKKYNLNISPATIRNEMAILEELGFITHPHVSAGRIPTDKGYRIYVDTLMPNYKLNKSESDAIKRKLNINSSEVNEMMNNIAKVIAELTNYTSIATSFYTQNNKVKHIHLLPIDEHRVMLVIVTDNGKPKEIMFKVERAITVEGLIVASNYLNQKFYNKRLEDVLNEISSVREFKNEEILDTVFEILRNQLDVFEKKEVYYGGTENIFNFPEFSDLEKIKKFFQLINQKNILNEMFESDQKIKIGNENNNEDINDCSVIHATYKIGNNVVGQIGIIGPTRMNYSKVVAYIDYITKEIEKNL